MVKAVAAKRFAIFCDYFTVFHFGLLFLNAITVRPAASS